MGGVLLRAHKPTPASLSLSPRSSSVRDLCSSYLLVVDGTPNATRLAVSPVVIKHVIVLVKIEMGFWYERCPTD